MLAGLIVERYDQLGMRIAILDVTKRSRLSMVEPKSMPAELLSTVRRVGA